MRWPGAALLVFAFVGLAGGQARAAAVPADEAVWGDGQWSNTTDGVRQLTVPHGPGGVEFDYALDPSQRYKVVVDGRNVTNHLTLRWQLGSADPEYQAAPQAPLARTVEGVSELGVMLYQDTGATYDLNGISVVPCPECRTDAELRSDLLAQIPGLSEDLQSDPVSAAQKLLSWASPRIAWAATSDDEIDTFASSAVDTFDLNFRNGQSGVWCGGAADALRKLLELFGIDAVRVDIGDPATALTHAVVAIQNQGQVYVLDPTFGIRFIDQDGQPLSVGRAWDLWLSGDDADVRTHAEDLTDRVVPNGSAQPPTCATTWSTGCSIANFLTAFGTDLAADGIRRDDRVMLDFLAGSDYVSRFQGSQAVFDSLQAIRDRVRADPRFSKLRAAPAPETAPTITGTAAPGSVVSADGDEWDALSPVTSRSYQWLRCGAACDAIPGATQRTYPIADGDAGANLRVRVAAANAFGSGPAQESAERTVTAPGSVTPPPDASPPPTSSPPPTASPPPASSRRPAASRPPASPPSHLQSDVSTSKTVRVRHPAAPRTRIVAHIRGVARVGHRLTCSVPRGTWVMRRAWKHGKRVLGRRSTYVVKRADRGRVLTCHVRVRKGKGSRIVGTHVRVRRK